jgi:UDP-N-acetylmuramoyl-L-alanyl-D-glutamate--2,6-diaminopimelate ligase
LELSFLLKPFSFPVEKNVEVRGITENSKEVLPGFLFFAYRGFKTDGNKFVKEAVERGASAVFTDSKKTFNELKGKLPVFYTEKPRELLALLSARFYGNPERDLSLIGVTGTNGKTTTAYLIFQALSKLGERAGIIGTVEWGTLNERSPSQMTTPSPTQFFKMLSYFKNRGVKWVICEVSSHALELKRVYNVNFEGTVFTNLSQDHLDFHKTMWSYFLSKERLFFQSKRSVVNVDDPFGKTLLSLKGIFPGKTASFGFKGNYQILEFKSGELLKIGHNGEIYRVKTNLIGKFNAYNLAGAFAVLSELGIPKKELETAFDGVKVPGRLEEVYPNVFVDYAHTPDALKNVLETLKERAKGRLIVVFGAGGNRDREKRKLMGKVASEIADLVIVTSDNPRNEPVERIISDILKGIEKKDKVIVEFSRRAAIELSLLTKREEDLVLIAGKGHENYQIIGNLKIPFSDKKVVEDFYGRKGTERFVER